MKRFNQQIIDLILQYTPRGFDKRMDRKVLAQLIGIDERTYRIYVEYINANKIAKIVGGVGGCRGYFIPLPGEEHFLHEYTAKERAKARAIAKKCDAMEDSHTVMIGCQQMALF